jgi:transcriptional regulator with XRE-family HTH domain
MNPTNEPYDPNPSTPRARAREAGAGEGEGEGSGVKAGTSPPPVQAETPEAAWQGAEPEGDTRIRELAAQGYSQREIAQEVGCSRQPVEDVLAGIKRNSCEKGQPEPEPEPDDDAAVFDSTSADDRVNEAISTAWQTLVKELGGGRLMEVVDMDMLERAREAEQAQSGAGRMQLMSEARRAAERASEAAE